MQTILNPTNKINIYHKIIRYKNNWIWPRKIDLRWWKYQRKNMFHIKWAESREILLRHILPLILLWLLKVNCFSLQKNWSIQLSWYNIWQTCNYFVLQIIKKKKTSQTHKIEQVRKVSEINEERVYKMRRVRKELCFRPKHSKITKLLLRKRNIRLRIAKET